MFEHLFEHAPTLRLLRSQSAGFVLGFFQSSFKESGQAQIAEEDVEAMLDAALRERRAADADSLARTARDYLTLWCDDAYRYLQKRFSEERGSYVYQLTRHSEKALSWIEDLRRGERRGYTTSESRFTRIVSELRRIERETNDDPETRRRELLRQRDVIDAELGRLRETGRVDTLDPAAVKDALNDLESMIGEFLADFRAIEEHFREQAREIQRLHLEQQLSKGDLVAHALDADEALRGRDQGRSYFGFRQSIVPVENREELQALANRASELARSHGIDPKLFENLLRRLFTEVTTVQSVYRRISGQLRRVVEEQSTQQTRYILELLGDIRRLAHAHAETPPEEPLFHWEEPLRFNNLMEAGFWEPPEPGVFGKPEVATDADRQSLEDALARIGKPLDLPRYRRRVAEALGEQSPVSLRELVRQYPIEEGAIDLVGYIVVASEGKHHLFLPSPVRIDLNRPLHPRWGELEDIHFLR